MRKNAVSIIFLCFCSLLKAQSVSDSLALVDRLTVFMRLSKNLDIEKTFDFTHPSLFKLASRKQLLQAMEEAYDPEEMSIRFDTMFVSSISLSLLHDNSWYRRVDYYSVMTMHFLEDDEDMDSAYVNLILSTLKTEFVGQNVSYDRELKKYVIKGFDQLIAIKDPEREWMFWE